VYYFYIRCPEQLHEESVHREVKRLQYPFVLLFFVNVIENLYSPSKHGRQQ